MSKQQCQHLLSIKELKKPRNLVCEECVKTGDSWVHLRTCQSCGVTLCCDNSPNQHASKHYRHTSHPVIISAQPGERWLWCYDHKLFMKYEEGEYQDDTK